MKWLIKREFWEHKGGFLWAPVAVGGVIATLVIASVLAVVLNGGRTFRINGQVVGNLAGLTDEQKSIAVAHLFNASLAVAIPLFLLLAFVLFFFCLGALFDERKDRSVLFWKSLPVTDGATVLSKVAIALGVAPLITLGIAFVTLLIVALALCSLALSGGIDAFGEFFMSKKLYLMCLQVAAIIPVYALWALPTVGWLLMVGAWVKTKPFLWAVGVPLLTAGLVAWINRVFSFDWNVNWIWQCIVGRGLLSIMPGSWFSNGREQLDIISGMSGRYEIDMGKVLAHSWGQLATPDLWIGVIAGAAMIYAAIRIRRWKDEG
jgi:ABC-2 type transport system permease protein